MGPVLVIHPTDYAQFVSDVVKCGAVPGDVILTVWQALEHIKAVALPLPDYTSGADPKCHVPHCSAAEIPALTI